MSDRSDEDTDDPHYADRRNFYKVEKWSRDGLRVELMLYAGSSLDKARRIFERATKRPRIRLTHPAAHAGAGRVATARNVALTLGKFSLLDSAAAELCYRMTVIGYDDASAASRHRGPSRKPLRASSCATATGRHWPLSIARTTKGDGRRPSC